MTLLCVAETAHPAGLSGEQRRLFDVLVRQAGGDPAQVQHVGVTETTKISEARAAMPTMAARLAEVQPEKVIALGGTAATVVQRAAKKVAITRERGLASWLDYEGGRAMYLSTVSPAMVLRRTGGGGAADRASSARDWFRDLQKDVTKWVQQPEPLPIPEPEYVVPSSLTELRRVLRQFRRNDVVSCDLETEPQGAALEALRAGMKSSEWEDAFPGAGSNPLKARIMSFGAGQLGGPYLIVRRPLLADQRVSDVLYDWLWTRGRVVGHNFKFDLQFLARHLGSHAPLGAQIADTMLMSFLLDERPVRSIYRTHGLKDISRYRYDVPDYHFDWPDFWRLPDEERPWDLLDKYHALDLHQTARLYFDLKEEFNLEPCLWDVHDNLVMPATLALAEIELRGIPVDREYLMEYRARLDRRMERRLRALRAAIGDPEFNPGSGKEVEALLFDDAPGWALQPIEFAGYKVAITNVKRNSRKEHLEKLATTREAEGTAEGRRQAKIMRSITAFRHDAKARETYAEGLLRASEDDGRVHSSFNLAGAVTGRLSSSEPNLQNIPKRGPTADAIRRAFKPAPGWLLVDADYSQLELRVAALLSRDERFAAVYREGRDIHKEVASAMFHKPQDQLDYMERYLAKAVDFGALYGRSGKAISLGAEMEYYEKVMGGTKWTAEEAQAFVDRFLDGFPGLRRWMGNAAMTAEREQRIETLFGRVRRFPLVLKEDRSALRRQAFNTPIQSVASDTCLSALCRLEFALDPDEARVLVTIHDSIMLEVREEALPRVAKVIVETMEAVPPPVARANVGLGVPFKADVKAGLTWQDDEMHDVELEPAEQADQTPAAA